MTPDETLDCTMPALKLWADCHRRIKSAGDLRHLNTSGAAFAGGEAFKEVSKHLVEEANDYGKQQDA